MSKTFIGVGVAIIGWLGFADIISESDLAGIVDATIALVGFATAIYGRVKASGKVNWLGIKE